MYHHSVAHLDISLDKIFQLWQSYRSEHLAKPLKNTVSVKIEDLEIFNDEPWISSTILHPATAFFGITPPNSKMPPHRDPSNHPEVIKLGYDYHPWALNIPLTTDLGSRMVWHRAKTGSQTKLNSASHSPYNNVRVPMADLEDLYEVASVTLDRPMLVNTFEWHSVTNETDQTRLIFSMRFDKPTSMREASLIFR
jgi:hypothetical protein